MSETSKILDIIGAVNIERICEKPTPIDRIDIFLLSFKILGMILIFLM